MTLRLETGASNKGARVDGITAKNIICRNGHAAVMASPHCQSNGVFNIENVTSYALQCCPPLF
eukprot:COSAG02_NODE_1749_length_11069_cov_88.967274_4_plen_63_part_00